MSEFSLPAIQTLGAIDRSILSAERRLARAPSLAAPQQARVAEAKKALEELKAKNNQAKLTLKQLESSVRVKEEEIGKTNVALNTAKSNDEYQTLLRKIDRLKQEVSDTETAGLHKGMIATEPVEVLVIVVGEGLRGLRNTLFTTLTDDICRALVAELRGASAPDDDELPPPPPRIEHVAATHEDDEVFVVLLGTPDQQGTLRVPGGELSEAELLAFYDGKVARWQVPDRVIFVDALPLGATGKVLKNRLREEYGEVLIETT